MKIDFINALQNKDLSMLKKTCKTDLHNHSMNSCTRNYLIENGIYIPNNESIVDIASMISFSRTYINPLAYNKKTMPILLKGNFENCINTGVRIVGTSVDYKICMKVFDSNINEFINFLESFKYDELTILWELGISRDTYVDEHKDLIMQLLKAKFFIGIDLYATENSVPNEKFIDFYKVSNSLNMITAVHAGETLGADYIADCINDFNPKQIQHGIRIIEDKRVMELAKNKGIVFNVCPTSNVILGYAKSIKEHPIGVMYNNGLKVTIASDDVLFFNSNINDEYLALFNDKVLSAKQLDEIRENGIIESHTSRVT